jgi:hypothetical protein
VVLDIVVQEKRGGAAAKRFFRRLLKGLQYKPKRLIADGLRSYGVARHTPAHRHTAGRPATRSQIPLHHLPMAPDLRRDPSRAPPRGVQPLHRRHLVRRSHRLSPPVLAGCKRAKLSRHSASPCHAGWLGS